MTKPRELTLRSAVLLLAVLASACAVSPERVRAESLSIDAAYAEFDCTALTAEAVLLDAEIERADKIANSPIGWVPFVNLLAFPATARGIKDLESATARRAGVDRAQARLACPVDELDAVQP